MSSIGSVRFFSNGWIVKSVTCLSISLFKTKVVPKILSDLIRSDDSFFCPSLDLSESSLFSFFYPSLDLSESSLFSFFYPSLDLSESSLVSFFYTSLDLSESSLVSSVISRSSTNRFTISNDDFSRVIFKGLRLINAWTSSC